MIGMLMTRPPLAILAPLHRATHGLPLNSLPALNPVTAPLSPIRSLVDAPLGSNPRFHDRHHAGRVLASWLLAYTGRPDVRILALPHALPLAAAIAEALTVPFAVFQVCPLCAGSSRAAGAALGYLTSGEVVQLNHGTIEALELSRAEVEQVLAAARNQLAHRELAYHADRAILPITGQTVLLVDDGLTAGASLRAATLALRQLGAATIIAALPVVAPDLATTLHGAVDELVGAITPTGAGPVEDWYEDLTPPSVAEVRTLLTQAARSISGPLRERHV